MSIVRPTPAERDEYGMTERGRAALDRRVARAQLAEARRVERLSTASAASAARLVDAVPLVADAVMDDGASTTTKLRGTRLLLDIARAGPSPDDAPKPLSPQQHLHVHVTPDTLDAAMGHLSRARSGEGVNDPDDARPGDNGRG